MQRLVPVSFGKSRIEEIIKEEMNHVTIIAKELAALARA
jgi:hypothetical protein